MKQSANALTYSGLAGAVIVAGATQAYGTVVNVQPPTSITGHAPDTSATQREYWNIDTGTTSTTAVSGYDINFGYYNHATGPNEFFTGLYVAGAVASGGGVVSYYASNMTNYAYGLATGKVIGTGGDYATFGQKAGYYSIMSLTYNGNAYAIMQPGTPYYIGFKFTAADGLLHDGWLELESDTYTDASHPGGLTFLAAAWNTTPDTSGGTIQVGQMGTNPIPEPGTLSALALGAAAVAGVGLKRRRKLALAAAQA